MGRCEEAVNHSHSKVIYAAPGACAAVSVCPSAAAQFQKASWFHERATLSRHESVGEIDGNVKRLFNTQDWYSGSRGVHSKTARPANSLAARNSPNSLRNEPAIRGRGYGNAGPTWMGGHPFYVLRQKRMTKGSGKAQSSRSPPSAKHIQFILIDTKGAT